jgi:hypothetical protein
MSKTNPQIQKIPEILWLITGILALMAAIHKFSNSGQYYVQYFVISFLSLLMYLYRRHRRINFK